MIRSLLQAPPPFSVSRFPHVFLPRKFEFYARFRRTHIQLDFSSRRNHRSSSSSSNDQDDDALFIDSRTQPEHTLLSAERVDYRDMQKCVFELRDSRHKSLLGYGLLDDNNEATLLRRRLIAFDYLGADELTTHSIGEEFWAERVRRSISRRQRHFATTNTTALRLVHGSADGLPHIFVDQLGPSAISVGCNSGAVSRAVLPSVVRAVEDQLRPVELLVSIKQPEQQQQQGDGKKQVEFTTTTELISDIPVGSALLPRDSSTTEFGVSIPRLAGTTLLPFDVRSRGARRFLREVSSGKAVALIRCDVATASSIKSAPCSSLAFFSDSTRTVRTAQRRLLRDSGSNIIKVVPATPDSCSKQHLQAALVAGAASIRVVVIQLEAEPSSSSSSSASVSEMIKPLLPSLAADCLVVFLSPKNHDVTRWVDDGDDAVDEDHALSLDNALEDCRRELLPNLRVVKFFDASALPDFPVSSGGGGARGWKCPSQIVAVACVFD